MPGFFNSILFFELDTAVISHLLSVWLWAGTQCDSKFSIKGPKRCNKGCGKSTNQSRSLGILKFSTQPISDHAKDYAKGLNERYSHLPLLNHNESEKTSWDFYLTVISLRLVDCMLSLILSIMQKTWRLRQVEDSNNVMLIVSPGQVGDLAVSIFLIEFSHALALEWR